MGKLKKILMFLIIVAVITSIIAYVIYNNESWGITLTNNGNTCIYNGRKYNLYSSFEAKNIGKVIGVNDGFNKIRITFYEISKISSSRLIARKTQGLADFTVYKEVNDSGISIKDFQPYKIDVGDVIIRNKNVINKLINIVTNNKPLGKADSKKIYSEQLNSRRYEIPVNLYSNKYSSLIYCMSYYKSIDDKMYIIDLSKKGTGLIYKADDLFKGYVKQN